MLILIVLIFIVCHFMLSVPNTFECVQFPLLQRLLYQAHMDWVQTEMDLKVFTANWKMWQMMKKLELGSIFYWTGSKPNHLFSYYFRRDDSVAMMLILIVVIFIVCHSIRSVVNTYECVQFALYGDSYVWPTWIEYLVQCSHLALVINSSSNILIYCW